MQQTEGHKAIVNLLLDTRQVDVNPQDEYNQTPLHLTAIKEHEAVVELSLASGQVDAM